MRNFTFTPCLPQWLRRLPWLVAVLALWGLVHVPTPTPQSSSERVGSGAVAGPSQRPDERGLRGGDSHPGALRLWRETQPPQPWPDLPPAPPQPALLLARQYTAAAGSGQWHSARVRAAYFGKWQLEGG